MRGGCSFAGIRRRDFPLYSRLITVGLAIVAMLFASASIDYWTVMRFFGSRGLTLPPDAWRDQVFSRPLSFYLFDLPFYSQVVWFVFVLAILCALVFWATARGWQLWMRGTGAGDVRSGGPRADAAGRQPHRLRAHHRRGSCCWVLRPCFFSATTIFCSTLTPS